MTRKEFIRKLQLCYFGEKKAFNEIVKYFDTLQKHCRTAEKLQRQLDSALGILSEMNPPCEMDGFMDKHTDYCRLNCGVDEEVFKKCWLIYIDEILERTDK